MNERIEGYVYAHKDELVDILARLVAVKSVKGEASENAPFGEGPRAALAEMDKICTEAGFDTHITENAVGTAELKVSGEEAGLGILCHLDVVPVNPENWESDPFTLTKRDGKLYGRGAIDDKGPLAAAFIALKCVKELGIPLKRGVKLIYGTDEENGSADLELFMAQEKLPENVFTPDAEFPVINIEKGMMRSRFSAEVGRGALVCFHGGSIPNAVADHAECELCGISDEEIGKAVQTSENRERFEISDAQNGNKRIVFKGASAHASTPETGVNAVTALIGLLSELLPEGSQKDILKGLKKCFPYGQTDGEALGLKVSDERSGALTAVFSILDIEDGKLEGCIDVRFPLCLSLAEVENAERKALEGAGCKFCSYMGDEPHETPSDSQFVQTLLRVYEQSEGGKAECLAIGGGTYVHNIAGGVAFGAERGETDYHMHAANEFITEEELLKDAVLFAEAIAAVCG